MPTKTKSEFIEKYRLFGVGVSDKKDAFINDLNSVITSEIEARMPSDEEVKSKLDDLPNDTNLSVGFQMGLNWLKNKLK